MKKGDQLTTFGQLTDDGSTAAGCWIYCGQLHRQEQHGPARHRRSERARGHAGLGVGVAGEPARPLQRARPAIPTGKPWDPRSARSSSGTARSGSGPTYRTTSRTCRPTPSMAPFIMNPEGVGRLFARRQDGGRAVPGALRAVREPARRTRSTRGRSRRNNPAARIYAGDRASARHAPTSSPTRPPPTGSPSTSTSGRSTRASPSVLQPEQFVEIGEALAKEKGIRERRPGQGPLEARRDHREGGGDEADPAAQGRREGRSTRSGSRSTGGSRGSPSPGTSPTR